MNFENLTKLPIEELRVLAAKHEIKVHHKLKSENIAKLIIDKVTNPQQELKHPAAQPKQATKVNTEEEVRQACEKFLSKEGFIATFKEDTWNFKFAGAEDSGHMSVPLRIIRMKAENVSRGARKPPMVTIDGERIMAAG